MVKFVALY